jgi:HlyD family type I secretion membrane fusion protein
MAMFSSVKHGVAKGFKFLWALACWPFFAIANRVRKIYAKWYGPLPLQLGGAPVDHSAPDMDDGDNKLTGRALYVMIVVFFGIALIWAVTAEIDEQVRAEGIIVVPSDVQHVQSLLPGSVVQINVKLGAVVNRGDVLFQLEDEDVLANFEDNEITFHSARAAEIRLAAELAGGNELRFPDDLTAQAPAVVQQERVLFSSRQQALQSRLLVLEDAVNTLERSIVEKQAESRILTSQAQLYAEEVALLEPLVAAGHEPKAPLLAARTRYQQAIGAAELAQLAADARKSDLQGKRREKQSLIANFKAEAAAELVEAKTKAAQYLSRQEALRGKVRHAEIRSPLTGTVSAVHVKTIGAVVQAGTVLVDIVPSEAVLLARAQISPQHVANVRPGQIARLSVSAYDPSRYGVLMGVVQRVAKNTTQLENQMPFYETIIEIPELRLTKSGVLPDITAGMPLTVDILGDKRTVINYIMTPIEKSWNTAFREK